MDDHGSLAKDIGAVCGATVLLVVLLLGALLLWTPARAREQTQPPASIRTADQAPDQPVYFF
jgi:hypothetical protein